VQKSFIPKFNLPELKNYRVQPEDSFWLQFPVRTNIEGKSLISPTQLLSLARSLDMADMPGLQEVLSDLNAGADIGCRGAARQPTWSGRNTRI